MNYSLAATDDEARALIAGGFAFDIALVSIDSPAISGMALFSKIEERSFRVPRIALASAADLKGIRAN